MPDLSNLSPWIATAVVAIAAVLAGLTAHWILSPLLLRATVHAPVLHSVVRQCRRAARLLLPTLALQLVWQAAGDDLRLIQPLRHLNGLVLIAAATWLVISTINGLAAGIIAQHPADVDDNLQARRIHTQARVLARSAMLMVLIAGAAMMLMTFPGARQVGASLLASAGVIGIVAGLAAKPVFSNLIAGLQIALAQPLRIDDVLIVQGEWGRVEEITGTYVVLKIWDDRRLIIPLQWFIENPFQNWTRTGSQLLGSVFLYVDFRMPVAPLRAALERLIQGYPEWDRRFFNLQVTDVTEQTMQLRVLCTAESSSKAFDLRCKVREDMIAFMQKEYPQYLPTLRVLPEQGGPAGVPQTPSGLPARPVIDRSDAGIATVPSAPDN